MQIGMIGLGRMGANMVRRLMQGSHQCVVYDLKSEVVEELSTQEGAIGVNSLAEMIQALDRPRAVWIMVPAGATTEATIRTLSEIMDTDDIIIDGGNSFFKQDIRHAHELSTHGIHYLDVGTSGGVWGVERGYCLMVGGAQEAFQRLEPIFETLAPEHGSVDRTPGRQGEVTRAEKGYLYCGPAGAGHFVKMVHNGIEYGLMQAYAEGFGILKGAASSALPEAQRYQLNLSEIAELWRRGSVIGSWLLDLTSAALLEDPSLKCYTGYVEDSGEGRWTVETAIEEAVPAEVIAAALFARFRSRQEHTFAEKIISAMREQFGGHTEQSGTT